MTKAMMTAWGLVISVMMLLSLPSSSEAASAKLPHIIFVVADDLGEFCFLWVISIILFITLSRNQCSPPSSCSQREQPADCSLHHFFLTFAVRRYKTSFQYVWVKIHPYFMRRSFTPCKQWVKIHPWLYHSNTFTTYVVGANSPMSFTKQITSVYVVGENSPMIGVSSFIQFIAQLLQYLRQRVRWTKSFPQLVCWFCRSVSLWASVHIRWGVAIHKYIYIHKSTDRHELYKSPHTHS